MKLDIDAPAPYHDFALPLKETEKYVVLEVETNPLDRVVVLTVVPRKTWESTRSVDPIPEDSATAEDAPTTEVRLKIYDIANRLATDALDVEDALLEFKDLVNANWYPEVEGIVIPEGPDEDYTGLSRELLDGMHPVGNVGVTEMYQRGNLNDSPTDHKDAWSSKLPYGIRSKRAPYVIHTGEREFTLGSREWQLYCRAIADIMDSMDANSNEAERLIKVNLNWFWTHGYHSRESVDVNGDVTGDPWTEIVKEFFDLFFKLRPKMVPLSAVDLKHADNQKTNRTVTEDMFEEPIYGD